ncbi:glycosyltransferase [Myceligenerans pegani]|uniref:Glycosyltransferase n=1 Tax=Myceligenerans pegani TaxID=2776917 RepID=A0ABR9MV10_9MICO|nr:glycosyltransferase [Myceligenerans sp. TRM 65318]MBE1875225.1 glycosyltransferase [Myceligenerans sp. TRM 65318]MBE3017496.1 glycosyltransferase [Myceligenerans sp. TRM 65318]
MSGGAARARGARRRWGTTPQLSLVMTVLNEERGLPAFLESLSAQTLLPDEVVVVDGGSTDATVSILESWGATATVKTTVIEAPGANISEGRNLAIERAQHELIAVTDAGTCLDAGWLDALVAAKREDVDVVAGFFEPMWTSWSERLFATVLMPLRDEIDPDTFLPSSRSLLVTRDAWRAAGGYPEWLDYCEDLVFDLAMKRDGLRFAFAPGAVARWSARDTWRAYAKQYYRYARGDGKSGLWPRRHALRYGAYLAGIAGWLGPYPAVVRPLLVLGFLGYCAKFFRRAWRRRPPGALATLRLLTAVPAVVVTGDLAKMAGYPAGLAWRRRSRPGE